MPTDKIAEKKIVKAVVKICLTQPFWATILYSLPRIEDRTVDTGWTDGRVIAYNPDFINRLPQPQVATFLAHEIGHVLYQHHLRRGHRDPEHWNVAGDQIINNILTEAEFAPIEGWCCDPQYKDFHTERVYDMIPKSNKGGGGQDNQQQGQGQPQPGQQDPQPQPGQQDPQQGDGSGDGQQDPQPQQDHGGCGGVRDMKNDDGTPMSEGEKSAAEEDLKQRVAQAANSAKNSGKMPGFLKELVEEFLEPNENWRDILSQFVGKVSNEDYSYMRPNAQYMQRRIVMPTLFNETFGKVVFAVDTSCSVSTEDVKAMFTEIMGTLGCYTDAPELTVITCDTQVNSVQHLQYGDDLEVVGRGGTDFAPVMEWIQEHMYDDGEAPVALIYHTDGYCGSFGDEPDIPVLWALSGDHKPKKKFEADLPFGEVVVVPSTQLT